jgi:hypothetical protein
VHTLNRWVPEVLKMAGMGDWVRSGDMRHFGVTNHDLGRWPEADADCAMGAPVQRGT